MSESFSGVENYREWKMMRDGEEAVSTVAMGVADESVAIHCVVEYLAAPATSSESVTMETFNDQVVQLAAKCPFVEIVPAVLCQLGYGLDDCIGANGTIHVRNWKPMSCQSIADSPLAEVGVILSATLASLLTLRIRLHRLPKRMTVGDVEDKMAVHLRDRIHSGLDSSSCPVDKEMLDRIINKDFVADLVADSFRAAITRWYGGKCVVSGDGTVNFRGLGLETTLEESFQEDSNPNSARIGELAMRLSTSARGHVTVDSVADWFANRRRQRDNSRALLSKNSNDVNRKYVNGLTVDCHGATMSSQSSMTSQSPPAQRSPSTLVRRIPILPNRNAVYVLDAILPKPETQEPSGRRMFGDDDDDDEREMEIVCDSDVDEDVEEEVNVVDGCKLSRNGTKTLGNHNVQEEATDLRVKKTACRSDSGASVGSGGDDDRSPRDSPSGSGRHPETSRGVDVEHGFASMSEHNAVTPLDYFSGSGEAKNSSGSDGSISGESPTYQSALSLMSNRHLFRNGPPTPPPPSHPLTSLYQHHQRALQLAAMSRVTALGLHLSGHGFAPWVPSMTSVPGNGRGSSQTTPDDFYGSVAAFDGKSIGNLSSMRNESSLSLASDRSTSDLVNGMMPKAGCSPQVSSQGSGSYNSTPSSADPNGAGKRSRVFIDPLTEIPKLERWFADDTHPSSYVIEKYTDELNRAPYRQRFPRLEPKNLQLWFKNHRAKMKRQRETCSAAAAAAAAVVAAAHSAATSSVMGDERSRANGMSGFSSTRQGAPPYGLTDALHQRHQHQLQFGGRSDGDATSNGRSGEFKSTPPTAAAASADVIGLLSGAAAAAASAAEGKFAPAEGIARDSDYCYGDDEDDSVDGDDERVNSYGKRMANSDDDDDDRRDDKYFSGLVTSGFASNSGTNGGGGSGLFSVNGNSGCKELRRETNGSSSSSYSAAGCSRNGNDGNMASSALDALVLRLQGGPFVTKPEVH